MSVGVEFVAAAVEECGIGSRGDCQFMHGRRRCYFNGDCGTPRDHTRALPFREDPDDAPTDAGPRTTRYRVRTTRLGQASFTERTDDHGRPTTRRDADRSPRNRRGCVDCGLGGRGLTERPVRAEGAAQAKPATQPEPLAIGSAAPDFSLPGVDGKTYSLASFKASKVLAVVFTAVHCPTAEVYEGRIKKLVADYEKRGVAFVAIQPNNARRSGSTRWATPTSATRSRT